VKRLLLVVVGALTLASPALADTTYTDATGEDPAAADIGTIVVSNDATAHTFTVKVQITNMPTLEDNAEIDLLFDADRNTATGTTVTVSGPAKAGKKFVVGPFSVNLSDGTSVDLNGLKCSATLGAAKLKGTGKGGCTFTVPKTAKGKKLSVKVTGTSNSVTLSKTLRYVVK
jgi:hypothetical protein